MIENVLDFTVILPIKGTKQELEFAEKTIPAILNLHPNELMFGVDSPIDPNLKNHLIDICHKYTKNKPVFVEVEHNADWNMHLTHLLYECVQKAKHDKILISNVDNLILSKIMVGYDIVGKNNLALCSGFSKYYVKSIRDRLTNYFYEIDRKKDKRNKKTKNNWCGTFWLYRPYVTKILSSINYSKIHNGADTFIYDEIDNHPTFDYTVIQDFICQGLDYENYDLPWRQFMSGIYYYNTLKQFLQDSKGRSAIFRILKHVCPSLIPKLIAFKRNQPYFLEGYNWAKSNPTHKVVLQAAQQTLYQWGYNGSTFIKEFKNWEHMGRTGTGY